MTPSEYFRRNFWVGASFLRAERVRLAPRGRGRPDHVGRRLPALRGQLPVQPRRCAPPSATPIPRRRGRWSRPTRPSVYGFDLEALRAASAGDIGPTVAEVATPLPREDYPTDSTCNAFDRDQVLEAW